MFSLTRYIYLSIFKGLDSNPHFVRMAKWGIYLLIKDLQISIYLFRNFILKRKRYDVILINPDKYDRSIRNIPIGIACIASYLEKHGIKTGIVDMWGLFLGKSLFKVVIKSTCPQVVGISIAITRQANEAYRLGNLIKKDFPEIKVVYGGLHATCFPEEAFEKGSADYVVLGEGEIPLLHLLLALEQDSRGLEKINGLAHKENGKILKNEKKQYLDLNKAPFPAYHILDMKSYDTDIHIFPHAKERAADIMTSRGCTNNCAYCSSPFLYKRNIRFKNPKLMINEVEHLRRKYGLKYYHFHDDDFLLDTDRIETFCELLIKKKLNIKWLCLTNVNTILKKLDLLERMRKAGCVTIEFGIETVDKNVLKKINKTQKTNNLISLSKKLKKYSIIPQYLVMSFNPGETLDSAYKTAQLIYRLNSKKNPPVVPYLASHHHNFVLGFLTTPYPGCRLYETADKEGMVLSKNWNDYHPERINFVPYSFLNDVPEKIESLSEENFLKRLVKYGHSIKVHRLNNYKIFFNLKNFKSYSNFLYYLYRLCDGKKRIQDIHKESLKYYPKNSIGYTCIGLRFLAMFRMVRSKK